ncbi:MAG: ABC-2 family transporter protein [Chloroflexi bacterium]|nr:ABC-2 family transporter protein [Chloroflexota bacterium]
MRRYLRLFMLFIGVEAQYELQYRANLVANVLQQAMVIVTSVAAVLILFSYTDSLNGWSIAQMLVLLGVYYVVQGMIDLIFRPSVERLMEQVRLGTLDYALLKPINSQFIVTLRHMRLIQLANVALGLVIAVAGVVRLGEGLGALDVLAFIVALATGFVLVYCLLLVIATLSFWFVRVENLLVIYGAFVDAARFPVDIYPGWLRVTLSSVIPIGLAVTIPAQAIAGRLAPESLALMLAAAVAAWLFSGWFWRRGLRSYTGASA